MVALADIRKTWSLGGKYNRAEPKSNRAEPKSNRAEPDPLLDYFPSPRNSVVWPQF